MFSSSVIKQIEKIAKRLDVEPAALLAVAEVESAGVATWNVKGKSLPAIRFEGHYFYRLLKGRQRAAAVAAGLASPKAGAVKNPASYSARYALLSRAAAINEEVAYESTSWGLGQVMGSHWKKLGFTSAADMVKMAKSGIPGQVEIMARYIKKFGLVDELQSKGFTSFAKQYNGPGYKQNRYDTKMAAAYKRWIKGHANDPSTPTVGASEGKDSPVLAIQKDLRKLGYYKGALDGKEGPRTRAAIKAFQKANGLVADGKYGPMTDEAVDRALTKAGRKTGNDAIKTGTGCTGVGAATDIVATQAEKLDSVSQYSDVIGYIVAVLVIGGVLLALWGLWKKYKTGTLEEETV
jgi:peptidoglycan hydrolase-like protein with peptidoglycan-binding domain